MSALMRLPRTTSRLKSRKRRGTLVIAVATLLAFSYGLQMYAIVPAYPVLTGTLGLSYSQVGLLVSLWFLGYAAGHIPAGFAVAAWGLKRIAVWGGFITALSSVVFAASETYSVMLIARFIGGVGMSMIVAAIFPLGAYWAKPGNSKLVAGILNGLGFTGGAAVGLYMWIFLVEGTGWKISTLIAALVGIAIALVAITTIETPQHITGLEGNKFSWPSTRKVLRSRSMWGIGLGSVAAYGAYFTVSQLGPGFAETEHGFTSEHAGLLGVVMLLVGIPGALIGGRYADKTQRFLPTLWVPAAIIVVLLVLIPFVSSGLLWVVLSAVGLVGMMYLSPANVAPGEFEDEIPRHEFATALGLVLTLGNLGAVVFPYVYALGTEQVISSVGWWLIGALSAISWLGFFLAREPRKGSKRTGLQENESPAFVQAK